MRTLSTILTGLILASIAITRGAEPTNVPRAIPLTRPEMKQFLEAMKQRTPRIPLPPLKDEESANLGPFGLNYESRLRALYLSGGDERGFGGGRPVGAVQGASRPKAGGFRSENEPGMTLDYRFKTSLFWIVSRTNNCQYCLGHQESKLLGAGMQEDEIAGLDCDWEKFTPAEQAAFVWARKITLEPHLITDADFESVRKHYTDLQVLEMIISVAGNNSINRWKEGVGVPQSESGGGLGRSDEGVARDMNGRSHTYLTPTSVNFQFTITRVAPLHSDSRGAPTRLTVCSRPELETRDTVANALEACRQRRPRLPFVNDDQALATLGRDVSASFAPQWMRLLANFPQLGKRTMANIQAADENGALSPMLKAQVSWIVARQDRAWYAVGQAKRRLREQGVSEDRIYELDGSWTDFSPKEQSLFTVAKNLAASPVVLTDDEVSSAIQLSGPRDVVQLIQYVATRAMFDRITEAAGLPVEP